MTFAMPILTDILEAQYSSDGAVNLVLVVTNYVGNPDPVTIPYTRDVSEEWLPDGCLYTLGLEVDAWFFAHPEFEIADYVAPPPMPEPTPAEKLAAAGLTVDELRALLGV